MPYLLFFFLSIICTLGVHSYLLITQRHNRKWSISVHAADHKEAFYVYVLGHVLGGAFFVLFARNFFYDLHSLKLLFYISCLAVIFEYIQALLPAKGKTDASHSLAAYIMWILFLLVAVLSFFLLTLSSDQKMLAAPLLLAALAMFIYVHFNHKKLYLYQMWMMVLVFSAMYVMIK